MKYFTHLMPQVSQGQTSQGTVLNWIRPPHAQTSMDLLLGWKCTALTEVPHGQAHFSSSATALLVLLGGSAMCSPAAGPADSPPAL